MDLRGNFKNSIKFDIKSLVNFIPVFAKSLYKKVLISNSDLLDF